MDSVPPATNLVLFGLSIFLGRIKHVMSPYVTSRILSFGTMCRGMKKIVSVPFAGPGIPCVSRPSSFPCKWVHVALVLGFAMRCRYLRSLPFSPIMEFAISQSQVIGNERLVIFCADISKVGFVMSMHDNIASCMMLVVRDHVLYPRGCSLLSSCKM